MGSGMKAVKWFLIILTSVLALFIAVSFFLPTDYYVDRSVDIDAPLPLVYSQVADLEAWQQWNPWSNVDKDMEVTYGELRSGAGAWYSWKSEAAGNGRMTIIEAEAPTRIRYLLEFEGYEDLPSYSAMLLKTAGGEAPTTVTWTFEGNVGDKLFARWMVLLMDKFVGASYEQGLKALKERCEKQLRVTEPDATGVPIAVEAVRSVGTTTDASPAE